MVSGCRRLQEHRSKLDMEQAMQKRPDSNTSVAGQDLEHGSRIEALQTDVPERKTSRKNLRNDRSL